MKKEMHKRGKIFDKMLHGNIVYKSKQNQGNLEIIIGNRKAKSNWRKIPSNIFMFKSHLKYIESNFNLH